MNSKVLLVVVLLAVAFSAGVGAEPVRTLNLLVPDYKVTKDAGGDQVSIPGGVEWGDEELRPIVPCVIETLVVPAPYRVIGVSLKSKSGLKPDSGLKLVPATFDTFEVAWEQSLPGQYPREDFRWRTCRTPDGGRALRLTVFPFRYDPATTRSEFWPNWQFAVDYAQSAVELKSVTPENTEYEPGETVKLAVDIDCPGRPEKVSIEARVRRGPNLEAAGEVAPREYTVSGRQTLSLEWSSAGMATGDYGIDVTVKSTSGAVLGSEGADFSLGRDEAVLTGFSATPQPFRVGDRVLLNAGLRNTGTTVLNGSARFQVWQGDSVVFETTASFQNLSAGTTSQLTAEWDTRGALKGVLYRPQVYAFYSTLATPPLTTLASTNSMPTASFTVGPDTGKVGQEVKFTPSAADPDGKLVSYRWEFGDGAESADTVAVHTYYQAGDYNVRLSVIDNEGGVGTAEKTVTVKE
jgi:chitodextrinase